MTESNVTAAQTPLSRIPFSPRAEASIVELSKWMRISAVIGFVGAVVKLIIALMVRHDVGQIVGSVVTFLVAYWSYQAAGAFAAMATTDTADQRYLMEGFSLLRKVFLMQASLVILGLAVVLIAMIGAAIAFLVR